MLIKYISCEGRYNIVYGYHFRILEELRFGEETLVHQRFSIPYFLLQSLMDSSSKVKKGNSQPLAHHGLIRILIEDALLNPRIPITWTIFNELPVEDDIRTFIYGVSEEETKQEEEDTKLDRDGMDKEETNTEGHDEEDTNTKEHDAKTREEEGIETKTKKIATRNKRAKWLQGQRSS